MKITELILNYEPKDQSEVEAKKRILSDLKRFGNSLLNRGLDRHFTSSALILNTDLTKLLLVHHRIYRTWTWVGGHADGNEDLFTVAIKEAQEETGINTLIPVARKPFSLEILTVQPHVRRGQPVPLHLHYNVSFVFTAPEDQLLFPKPDENLGVCWVNIAKISQFSSEPKMIALYLKIINRAIS